MTDQTTQQNPPGAVIAPPPAATIVPTLDSVKARALLLEIDGTQAATEVSQFLIAGRAQIVVALSFVEPHYHACEQKAAAAVKAAEAKVATAFAFSGRPAAPAAPAAAPGAQLAATPAAPAAQ
jgi:hypothetical protein